MAVCLGARARENDGGLVDVAVVEKEKQGEIGRYMNYGEKHAP
jgi:hypothetical protein